MGKRSTVILIINLLISTVGVYWLHLLSEKGIISYTASFWIGCVVITVSFLAWIVSLLCDADTLHEDNV